MDRLNEIGVKELSLLLRCGNAAKSSIDQISSEQSQTACVQLAANAAGKLEVLIGELSILRDAIVEEEEALASKETEIDEGITYPPYNAELELEAEDVAWTDIPSQVGAPESKAPYPDDYVAEKFASEGLEPPFPPITNILDIE